MVKSLLNLDSLLHPNSIAIVGLSSNPEHISYSLMENIVNHSYSGLVYPVNPKIKAIKGMKCYSSITEIPEEVDLAIIMLRPNLAIEVIEQGAKIGIKNFAIISSGFAEAGSKEEEERIKYLGEKYNLTILGPNCVGIINTYHNLNASFATKGMPKKGSISIVSQSGGFSIGIVKYLTKINQGISKLISVGNKAILQESHFLKYLVSDETTKVIALYVEDIKNFDEFEEAAYELLKANKPIVLFKGGITQEGSKASSSHTAALVEDNNYYQALFQKTGIITTERIEDLYFIISTIDKKPEILELAQNRGKKVLIISNCGGCGVINADFAIKHNLEVKSITEEFKKDLREILPPAAALNNPIDIVGDADHLRLQKTLKTTIKHKNNFDYLIINMGQQSTINMEEVSQTIHNLDPEFQQNQIIALSCMFGLDITSKEYQKLLESNIPVFIYPEDLTYSLSKIIEYSKNRNEILQSFLRFNIEDLEIDNNKIKQIISNSEKYEGFLEPLSTIEILKLAKLPIPSTQIVTDQETSQEILKSLTYPLVAKTASPKIIHKTENQGIYLNINNNQELINVIQKLRNIDNKIIIQEMIPKDLELILGFKKSKVTNKAILIIGIGGIMVEIFKNFSTILLPTNQYYIEKALQNINLHKIFNNFRGKNYNKYQLFNIINKLSEIFLKIDEIQEMEANPLIINEKGMFLVDFRIKCD